MVEVRCTNWSVSVSLTRPSREKLADPPSRVPPTSHPHRVLVDEPRRKLGFPFRPAVQLLSRPVSVRSQAMRLDRAAASEVTRMRRVRLASGSSQVASTPSRAMATMSSNV